MAQGNGPEVGDPNVAKTITPSQRRQHRQAGQSVGRNRKDEAIMSTLTYSHDGIVAPAVETAAPSQSEGQRKPIWRRIFDGMIASQQRRAEREIAMYLSSHGGLFTDDMEREIMRRMSGNNRRSV